MIGLNKKVLLIIIVIVIIGCKVTDNSLNQNVNSIEANFQHNKVINYGISDIGRVSLDDIFPVMATGGLRFIRTEFRWNYIEREQGEFHFDYYDKIVSKATENGIKILAVLAYGTPWASKMGERVGSDKFVPDKFDDYQNYVSKVVNRYKDKIKNWEIWNEPNGAYRFYRPGLVGDPKSYGYLLKAGYRGVKQSCPLCKIIFGGLFYHQELIMGAETFLENIILFHPDIGDYFDIFAFHPYSFYPPSSPPESDNFPEVPVTQMITNIRNILQKNNILKPIWINEIGWPSYVISEISQASYLVRSFVLSYVAGAEMYLWYTFIEQNIDTATAPPEATFGLFKYKDYCYTGQLTPKLSWMAYKNVVDILGNTTFSGNCTNVEYNPDFQYAYKFTSETDNICVIWQVQNNSTTVKIKDIDNFAIKDIFGKIINVIKVNDKPLFVIWKRR